MSLLARTILGVSLILALLPQAKAIQQGPNKCQDNPDTPENECAVDIATVHVQGAGIGPFTNWVGAGFYDIPSSPVESIEIWDPFAGKDYSKDDTASNTKEAVGCDGDDDALKDYEKGNPIDISTGAKIEREIDFVTSGLGNFFLKRTYNSRNASDGLFGRYWSSNFDYRLTSVTGSVTTIDPRHGQHTFVLDAGTGKYVSTEQGIWAEVVKNADGTYTATWLNEDVQRYSAAGKITSVVDQSGVGYTYSYDGSGKLSQITSTGGRNVQFFWTGTQLTKVVDPNGGNYLYTYANNKFGTDKHLLLTATLPGSPATVVTYHYEYPPFSGALTGKSVAGVRFSTFGYDAQGRAVSSEHAGTVQRHTFVYSTLANGMSQVTETNPYGKQTVYRFQGGNLVDATGMPSANCPSSLSSATWDANGYPNQQTAFNGKVTDYDYDSGGYQVRQVRGFGTPQAMTTDSIWESATGRLLKRTVVGDASIEYEYWPDGKIKSETIKNLTAKGVPNQTRKTSYAYTTHANGMISSISVDGPLPNDTMVYNYNTSGDLLTVVDPLGIALTYSGYSGLGQPNQVVDRYGVTTTYVYDARGRVLGTTRTTGGVSVSSSRTYDSRGRVVSLIEMDGTTKNYTYDNANRLLTIVEPEEIDYPDPEYLTESLEKKWFYTYNANSDLTQTRVNRKYSFSFYDEDLHKVIHGGSVTGEVTTFIDYDELGHINAYRGNNGQNMRYAYDESGFVTSTTDSLGRVTFFTYDGLDRISTSTDAKSGVTAMTYDAGGRVATVTDPRGLVTRYDYDGFGQLWRLESPDTGITTYAYDSAGRKTGMTRADLVATTYGFDGLGRITSRQVGSALQSFTYDSCANGTGRLCAVNDPTGSTTFTYSALGRVAQQVNTIASTAYTTQYGYDSLGRLTGVTYPDGKIASYGYAEGRLLTIGATPNGMSVPLVQGMHYQPFGALTSSGFGNGLSRTANFDNDGRLASIVTNNPTTGAIQQSLTFSWNANNAIAGIANARGAALTQSFTYDELGRLTGAGRGDGTAEGFGYDAVGNRTAYTKAGVTTTLAYGATNNRLVSSSNPSLLRAWTYDANGNSNGFTGADNVAVGLHYDGFGRLDSSSRSSQGTTYQVNGLGQRVSKAGPNGTTRFIYAPNGGLLAELKVGTGWTDYVHGEGEILGIIRSNTLYYVHNDQLGRPEVVTNAAKATVWAASNYAFERTVTTNTIGGLNVDFPGQYYDQETGTWYNMLRDNFDSTIGRYAQSDPVGMQGGPNTYGYVRGNPVNMVDPWGLDDSQAILLGAGVIDKMPDRTGSDYYSVNVSLYVFSYSLTVTKSGNVYFGTNTSKGTPKSTVSGKVGWSVTAGKVDSKGGCPVTATEVDNYVNGASTGVSGYFMVGGGRYTNSSGSASEAGFGMGFGMTPVGYNHPIGNVGFSW